MKLSSAQMALLSLVRGVRPVSPYKCDQAVLYSMLDAELVEVSWEEGTIKLTEEGRKRSVK